MAEYTRSDGRADLHKFVLADCGDLVEPDWILDHQLTNFNGASPVIQVTSAGLLDALENVRTGKVIYYYSIETFVVHKAENWTPKQAEDLMDLLADRVVECLKKNRTKPWKRAYLLSRTVVSRTKVANVVHLYEPFPVAVEIF